MGPGAFIITRRPAERKHKHPVLSFTCGSKHELHREISSQVSCREPEREVIMPMRFAMRQSGPSPDVKP